MFVCLCLFVCFVTAVCCECVLGQLGFVCVCFVRAEVLCVCLCLFVCFVTAGGLCLLCERYGFVCRVTPGCLCAFVFVCCVTAGDLCVFVFGLLA
jgi:hypothetical protein